MAHIITRPPAFRYWFLRGALPAPGSRPALPALERPLSVNGPAEAIRRPGNANICFEGFSGDEILDCLQPRLAASTGSACSSGIPEPSHVLRAMGLDYDRAAASVRFSLGFQTSAGDVEEAAGLIEEALEELSAPHGRSAPGVAWAVRLAASVSPRRRRGIAP